MRNRLRGVTAALLFSAAVRLSSAQTSSREFWPETDLFVQRGERVRLVFQHYFTLAPESDTSKASFSGFVEVAMRPLLRVELRNRNDLFRKRFLTFRGGYRRVVDLGETSGAEDRGIIEVNARCVLFGRFLLFDRNRGEFRWIHGQPFSARYRNRLRLERDLAIGPVKITPETSAEYFYDTRYDAWATMRYTGGFQVPAGRHVVFEPYLMWQVNKKSAQRHTGALGFIVNLFFEPEC